MLRKFLRSNSFMNFASVLAVAYLRFVRLTSKLIVDPVDGVDLIAKDWPIIYALWHSHLFLGPISPYPEGKHTKYLVSRHRDAELFAHVTQRFGFSITRGSGSPQQQVAAKGGASALREMARTLKQGISIGTTADVPKIGYKVGRGVIALAQMTGRPIYPVAMLTSNRFIFKKSWDRTVLPLPFGRFAFVVGAPFRIDAEADEAAREIARQQLEKELEKASARACFLADKSVRSG